MNTKITILELADLMAESTSTSSRMCELFIRELFATVSQALIDGESVKIKGIGTFKITRVKPRKSTNVNTGEPTELSSHNRLTFTPDKSLAEAVNQPFAQFETVILDDKVTDEKLAEIDEQYPSMLMDSPDEPLPLPPNEIDVPSPLPVELPITVEPLDVDLPQQPDMPVPPPPDDLPMSDEEIASIPQPDQHPSDNKEAPANDTHGEKTDVDTAVAKTVTEQVEPVKAEPVKVEVTPAPEEPKEAQPVEEPVKRRPMLVGIPIDGPSQPVPSQEDAEESQSNRHFYRPEPRNAYTPTPEQIEEASHKTDYRWLWALLCLLTAGVLIWLIARGGSDSVNDQAENQVVAADTIVTDNDSVPEMKPEVKPEAKAEVKPEAKPEVKPETKPEEKAEAKPETKAEDKPKAASAGKEVTDVVTSQIVLTTLAEKHYGSPWFWVYIYEENLKRGIINDPNNIRPGTRVVIPPASKYGINPKDKASIKKAQRKSWEYLKDK